MRAQEQQPEKDVMVVNQCEHCYGTLQENGAIKWGCDALHPEVLRQMDEREKREREDKSN